ncbi:MAG: hypothetical protein Q7R52_01800 [archaeon]|nr:hypothetical protein [archaeon]
MEMPEVMELVSELFDKIAKQEGDKVTVKLMEKWGLDNPHMLKTQNKEYWRKAVDNILLFRRVAKQ